MLALTVFAATLAIASCKIYDRCELARELRDVHEIPDKQLATWVCIARYESEFNTAAINKGSGDHGLFQISQLFWCSPNGHACGVSCKDLRDDDIEDDVICARRIYREHKRLSGDGFNAWVVYKQRCRDQNHAGKFIEGCFDSNRRISKVEHTTASPDRLSSVGGLSTKAGYSTRMSFGSSITLKPFKTEATTAKFVSKNDPNYTYSISKTGFKITKTNP